MTLPINDISRIVQYTATGGQTSFAIPFEFYSTDEIIVYVNGTQLTYSLTPTDQTEFSVTGVQVATGGNITLGSPGATLNDVVTVVSRLPNRRLTDFPVSGPFRIEELNEELDKIIIMIQQLDTFVTERMLLLEDYDEPDTMNRLPTKANRANKVLGFDADGQPTVSDGTLSGGVPALAGVTPEGDKLFYFIDASTGGTVDFTQFARDFIDALSDLSDPNEDSVLFWNDTTNTWEFKSISSLVIAAGRPSTRTITATTDTLVLADAGNRVQTTNASPVTITVPPDVYTEGDLIEVKQAGAGQITIAAGAGVTLESFGNILTAAGQNATIVLRYEGSNVWQLGGELEGTTGGSIGDLNDVDITTSAPTDGQALVWQTDEFVPGDVSSFSTVRTVAGTTDTLVIGDQNNIVETTNASPVTITVPPNSSVAFEIGSFIEIHQDAAGLVTIAQGAGVTIRSRDSVLDSAGEDAVLVLRKVGTNEWVLGGDLANSYQEATASEIFVGSSTAKYISPDKFRTATALVTLSDAATIAVDFETGRNFQVTLGGNRTLGNPTNVQSGDSGMIYVIQDGTGSRTLTLAANWKPIGGAPTLDGTAGAVEVFTYFARSATAITISYLGKEG